MDSVSLPNFQILQSVLMSSSGHHGAEEALFFPEIEKVTSEESIMNRDIDQHRASFLGIEAWSQYTSGCMQKERSEGPSKSDAAHFTNLIDGFAPQLVAQPS